MNTYELSFARITILDNNLAEVVVNEGAELNEEMVDQYHEFLLTHLQPPFLLLINKINAYTYNFQAQLKLADLEEIGAMAVISYNKTTEASTELLASYPRVNKWNMKLFSDRDTALAWLKLERN